MRAGAVGVATEGASLTIVHVALFARGEDVVAAAREEPALLADASKMVEQGQGAARVTAGTTIGKRRGRIAPVDVALVHLDETGR